MQTVNQPLSKPLTPEAYIGLQGIRSERAQRAATNRVINRVAEVMLLAGVGALLPGTFNGAPLDEEQLRRIILNEAQPNVIEAMWLSRVLAKPVRELFVHEAWADTYDQLQYVAQDASHEPLVAATRGLAAAMLQIISGRNPDAGKEVGDGE